MLDEAKNSHDLAVDFKSVELTNMPPGAEAGHQVRSARYGPHGKALGMEGECSAVAKNAVEADDGMASAISDSSRSGLRCDSRVHMGVASRSRRNLTHERRDCWCDLDDLAKRLRGESFPPGRFILGELGYLYNGVALGFSYYLVWVFMVFPTAPNPAPASMNWSGRSTAWWWSSPVFITLNKAGISTRGQSSMFEKTPRDDSTRPRAMELQMIAEFDRSSH